MTMEYPEERRHSMITLEQVELALRKYLDSYKKDLEGMCDENVATGILKHTTEKAHFEREEKKQIYEALNYLNDKRKIKWTFWVPLFFIGITQALTFIITLLKR